MLSQAQMLWFQAWSSENLLAFPHVLYKYRGPYKMWGGREFRIELPNMDSKPGVNGSLVTIIKNGYIKPLRPQLVVTPFSANNY